MAGALAGITVVDLSTHLSGPYCTMLLGDLGADVIKVERPGGGDEARSMPPFVDGRSAPFDVWNRNKRSIVLDAKNPADAVTLRALVARADVLVENFRPGTLERMGLGWEALHAAHPRLILASISGFGQSGPWAGHGGFDLMTQGMAGLMAGNGPPEGEPHRLPIAISDLTAGMQAAIGILAALNARHATGQGQRVEAALFTSALSLGVYEAAHVLALGTRPERLGQAHRGNSPYRAFPAADGWMTVGAAQAHFWQRFCGILEMPELLADERFATNADRVANNEALVAILAPRLRQKPRDHWLAAFTAAGIPAEPVLSYDEALAHPQAAAMGVVADIPGAEAGLRATLATPFRLSDTPPDVRKAAPVLGEHGAEIRAGLAARDAAE
ncbi:MULTISPECIES: CaiB/BaiF CoA transferase family protein [Roseomonadaceae]|uniref:CoA transferase n=1 Tax=Falsiroseomonas oleicola TaxID=2801474 RepID=A0ABS6H4C8_9PROT|nr:CoA transferase [Roseomonas oleicola]MBU8542260.1 CoA transferase [Roseomonas oleicola]